MASEHACFLFLLAGMTSYPEQMLYSLKQKKMITESDFLVSTYHTREIIYSSGDNHDCDFYSFSSVYTESITPHSFKLSGQPMVMKMYYFNCWLLLSQIKVSFNHHNSEIYIHMCKFASMKQYLCVKFTDVVHLCLLISL